MKSLGSLAKVTWFDKLTTGFREPQPVLSDVEGVTGEVLSTLNPEGPNQLTCVVKKY